MLHDVTDRQHITYPIIHEQEKSRPECYHEQKEKEQHLE